MQRFRTEMPQVKFSKTQIHTPSIKAITEENSFKITPKKVSKNAEGALSDLDNSLLA